MAEPKIDWDNDEEIGMTDDRRMRVSGAAESGYHEPTEQDIEDIRKDHHTSTSPHAVNADEFIRSGSSTGALQGPEDEENLHPKVGLSVAEGREIGTAIAADAEGPSADRGYPQDTTPESQTTSDQHGFRGAKRAAAGAGVDGDLDILGPTDGEGEATRFEQDDEENRESA